jgi:hypothetical protein
VVLVVVGASDCHGLSLDLGVEPNELARVVFNGTRMGRDVGCVLVVDEGSLSASVWCERMVVLAVVCTSIDWLCVVCVMEWFLDGCGKSNSY